MGVVIQLPAAAQWTALINRVVMAPVTFTKNHPSLNFEKRRWCTPEPWTTWLLMG